MWFVSYYTHLHTLHDGYSAGVQGSGPPLTWLSLHILVSHSGRKLKDKKALLQAIFVGEKSIDPDWGETATGTSCEMDVQVKGGVETR